MLLSVNCILFASLHTSNQLQNVRIAFNRVVECILYSFVVVISCFKPYANTPNENTTLVQYVCGIMQLIVRKRTIFQGLQINYNN